MKDIIAAIGAAIGDTKKVSVYRGTIGGETLQSYRRTVSERRKALDEFAAEKDEFWKKVQAETGLDVENSSFRVELLTGQIFEEVLASELEAEKRRGNKACRRSNA